MSEQAMWYQLEWIGTISTSLKTCCFFFKYLNKGKEWILMAKTFWNEPRSTIKLLCTVYLWKTCHIYRSSSETNWIIFITFQRLQMVFLYALGDLGFPLVSSDVFVWYSILQPMKWMCYHLIHRWYQFYSQFYHMNVMLADLHSPPVFPPQIAIYDPSSPWSSAVDYKN